MILVVGDIIVDEYVHGTITGQAREAKIPILTRENVELRLGGAANVAANIKALGGDPALFGIVVNDSRGAFVLKSLKDLGIPFVGLIVHGDQNNKLHTTVKTRFCENHQYLFRTDSASKISAKNLSEKDLTACTSIFDSLIKESSALVVSDYGYNTIDFISVQKINEVYTKYYVPVFVDSRARINEFKNAHTLLSGIDDVGPKNMDECKKMLLESGSDYLLLKLGKDGLLLFTADKQIYRAFEPSDEVVDTCGAGDSVLAAWTVACGYVESVENKLEYANKVGLEKIKHWGTTPVTWEI